jgi:hypothetical protein
MTVNYSTNNHTEISNALESGERKLDIAFSADGLLKDLPNVYIIPTHFFKDYVPNSATRYFLNVNFDKEPVEWVIDVGERPSS